MRRPDGRTLAAWDSIGSGSWGAEGVATGLLLFTTTISLSALLTSKETCGEGRVDGSTGTEGVGGSVGTEEDARRTLQGVAAVPSRSSLQLRVKWKGVA